MFTLHHHSRRAALLAASLGLFVLAGSRPAPASAQGSDGILTGTWKLNQERTQAENELQRGRDPVVGEGFRGRGRNSAGGSSRGGGSGGGEAAGGPGGSTAGLGPVGVFARPLPELVIEQNDTTVTLSDPSGLQRTLWVDGRKESVQMPGTEPMEISARWKGGKLTVERKFTTLGSVREIYSLSKDGKELVVEVRLSAPTLSQPMDSKRIYAGGPKE